MPCTCDGYEEQERRDTYAILDKLRATVCAMLRADPTLIDRLDYREAGIDKSWLIAWWNAHQRADQVRLREEENRRAKARLRAAALAKLTPQERAALGVDEE